MKNYQKITKTIERGSQVRETAQRLIALSSLVSLSVFMGGRKMRMSTGRFGEELEFEMKGQTLADLKKERTALKSKGIPGQIRIFDRCSCGCGGAHEDKNIQIIDWR